MEESQDQSRLINSLLAEKLLEKATTPGSHPTTIAGFNLARRESTNELRVFYKPFIGLTVRGSKHTIIGREEYNYGEFHCLVAGVDMPSQSYITAASPEKPFLALSLELDRGLVASLAAEMQPGANPAPGPAKSVAVMQADQKIMKSFLRLMELLEEPADIPVMAPMLVREIHYRLLAGPQGKWLQELCALGKASNQIAQAASLIRQNCKSRLNMEELGKQVA